MADSGILQYTTYFILFRHFKAHTVEDSIRFGVHNWPHIRSGANDEQSTLHLATGTAIIRYYGGRREGQHSWLRTQHSDLRPHFGLQ